MHREHPPVVLESRLHSCPQIPGFAADESVLRWLSGIGGGVPADNDNPRNGKNVQVLASLVFFCMCWTVFNHLQFKEPIVLVCSSRGLVEDFEAYIPTSRKKLEDINVSQTEDVPV